MYTLESLQAKTLKELRGIGKEFNVFPCGDKRCRQNWIDAIEVRFQDPPIVRVENALKLMTCQELRAIAWHFFNLSPESLKAFLWPRMDDECEDFGFVKMVVGTFCHNALRGLNYVNVFEKCQPLFARVSKECQPRELAEPQVTKPIEQRQEPIGNIPGVEQRQEPIGNIPGVGQRQEPIEDSPGVEVEQRQKLIEDSPGAIEFQRQEPIENSPGAIGKIFPVGEAALMAIEVVEGVKRCPCDVMPAACCDGRTATHIYPDRIVFTPCYRTLQVVRLQLVFCGGRVCGRAPPGGDAVQV